MSIKILVRQYFLSYLEDMNYKLTLDEEIKTIARSMTFRKQSFKKSPQIIQQNI